MKVLIMYSALRFCTGESNITKWLFVGIDCAKWGVSSNGTLGLFPTFSDKPMNFSFKQTRKVVPESWQSWGYLQFSMGFSLKIKPS